MKIKKSNKRIIKRISVAFVAVVLAVSAFFTSNQQTFAATLAKTTANLKKALYASVVYDCVNEGYLAESLATGSQKYAILSGAESTPHYIGPWLGNASGMITCKDAFEKFDKMNGKITENDIKSGGIFYNVYGYSSKAERRIKCSYAIINSQATGYINGGQEYEWPNGYYEDGYGELHSEFNAPAIWVYYNEDGWIGKVSGGPAGMNPNLGEETKNWVFDKNESYLCNTIVQYLQVYPIDGQDIHGNPVQAYAEVISSTDPAPFGEWGIHVDDSNAAHLNNINGHYKYYAEDVADTSKLDLKENGKTNLLENIKSTYFDGQTPEDYIKGNGDFKYALTGRYLFNGDGSFAAGCGGVTVSKDDENFDKLDPLYWNPSLDYVADVSAYKGSATSKKNFRTKFGGGLKTAGTAKSVQYAPWPDSYVTCDALAGEFNSASASSASIKQDVWKWINQTEIEKMPETPSPTPGNPGGGGEESPSDTDAREEACYAQAKSLGWIICPIIFGLEEVSTSIYQQIEPMIQVNESTITQLGSNSSDLYKAWGAFRGFANIIFVIIFMFIIFSQITGFGIDNYGIKKALPKVIVTAIMVNLSFYICAVAVDLSNIIGSGIRVLFESLHSGSLGPNSVSAVQQSIYQVLNFLTMIGLSTGAAGVAFALNGWAIIIPILLFLLTMIISIIFAFLVLGMRQAAVILCIVFAPIAFACNMLPNTEKIFKRWLDIFKAVILVYPIIGGLIGAGYFASSIILTNGSDFLMTIIAGLLCVLPYFMIPMLLSRSLAAVGNLGERMTRAGRNLGGGISRGINNSEGVRLARESSALDARYMRKNSRPSRWLDNKTMEAERKYRGRTGARAWIANHTIASNGRLRAAARNSNARVDNARETVVQSAQAAMAKTHRMENGGFAARDANLENQALEGAIADQTSLWENDGTFNNNARFENEVFSAATTGDAAKLEALMRKATGGSDKQRELLRKGMNRAFDSGLVDAATAGRFAAHVTGNGIYKGQNRSMHDQATALMNAVGNGTYGTKFTDGNGNEVDHSVESFNNDNFVSRAMSRGKQSAACAFNYDDGEFEAILKKAQNGTVEERKAIAAFMDQAQYFKVNDTTGQYNGVKREALDHISEIRAAALAGGGFSEADIKYSPNSLNIDHSSSNTPSSAPAPSHTPAQSAPVEPISGATRQQVAEHAPVDRDIERAIDQHNNGGGHTTDSGIWLPN
ncbi:hypothetical protein J6X90_03865 [Candidatus Saccharibacteria bacterium]|nr:hypothetical protein [Candidatus Saccharibacteria bacterium]